MGVGGAVGGVSVTLRVAVEVAPESATAVSVMSPADTTLRSAVPVGARSPAAPVMLTWSAPVTDHEAVTASGGQPDEGEIVKLVMTGAVEKAPFDTDSDRLLPSLVRLSFLMA